MKHIPDAQGNCSRWCIHLNAVPSKPWVMPTRDTTSQTRDELALAVAELWVQQNGWIPGGAKRHLEAVLGLPLPDPAVGWLRMDNVFRYQTDNPVRLHRSDETYVEWRARQ